MTTIDQIKAELRDIIELEKKTTPGEWSWDGQPWNCTDQYRVNEAPWLISGDPQSMGPAVIAGEVICMQPDAAFIAASRNLTPKMARALLGTLEILEHMTTYTTKAGTVASKALEIICREWEVKA